jgi:cysteine desulfurase/selenocysteine lyase
MVDHVAADTATWTVCPDRFEAGSPNLADALGFAAAAGYLNSIGMDAITAHETALTRQAVDRLARIPRVSLVPAAAATRSSIISINIEGIHPHDVAQLAGERGVALRAGHHCCQPLMQYLGLAATTRASFGIYNQPEDVDALISATEAACCMFG